MHRNKIKNQIILTKCDLLYRDEIAKQYDYLRAQIAARPFNHTCEELIVVSSRKLSGIKQLQEEIMAFLPDKGKQFKPSNSSEHKIPSVPTITPPSKMTLKTNVGDDQDIKPATRVKKSYLNSITAKKRLASSSKKSSTSKLTSTTIRRKRPSSPTRQH